MIGWLIVVCSAAILVAADLPRGDHGIVLREYFASLEINNHSRDQLQTLSMQMLPSLNLATSIRYTPPLLQCSIDPSVQASHILDTKYLRSTFQCIGCLSIALLDCGDGHPSTS
jgi:hypothetical protein